MTANTYGPIDACMACGATPLVPVLFLGFLPPVSTQAPLDSPLEPETTYPAEVLYCPSCRLAQLGYVVDPSVLFHERYTYTSGTTKSLRENFADLARRVGARFALGEDDLVVDIGSNDGTLLEQFRGAGHRVVGIEPSGPGDLAIAKGIPTVRTFLGADAVAEVHRDHGRATVVTAANVFAHIPAVDNVMASIGALLEPQGVFVSESDYLRDIVERIQYDTIHHEHLRYYSVTSIRNLLARHGFDVLHVERIPTHGGSIRVYAGRGGHHAPDPSVAAILAEEAALGLDGDGWIADFRARVTRSKLAFFALLDTLGTDGTPLPGIGAPARATTLLNYLGVDRDIVSCVLEVTGSRKIGHYMPGTRIPVLDESVLYDEQPAFALILSWHIADELCAILRRNGYRGDFVVPLPEPRIVRGADIRAA